MTGGGLRALAAARRVRDDVAAVDAVAGVAERLAVLMSAGVSAPAAWRHLSADAPADSVLAAAARAAEEGEPIAPALAAATAADTTGASVRVPPADAAEAVERPVRGAGGTRRTPDAGAFAGRAGLGGVGGVACDDDVDRSGIGGTGRRSVQEGSRRAWAGAECPRGSDGDIAVPRAEAGRPAVVERSVRPHRSRAVREREAAASAAWAALAAAWAVASETGAPLAASLRELAGALRDDAQLRREVRAALAGPKASAKLVTLLPVVAIGFGLVLGFETAAVLLGNPLGIVFLLVGAALLWAGARWNRALAAKAAPPTASPGLELDLLAIAMSSGTSIDGAVAVTGRAIATHLPGAASARHDIAATVRLATQAGAPVAELLRAEAFRQRRAARAEGAVRAAALSVRLMVPLGVCILPAFVLLGVAPLMISVVTGTLGGVR